MNRLMLCLLLMAGAFLAPPAAAAENATRTLVVALDGNDKQPGTNDRPLRTVARAQALVREQLAAGARGDWKVVIRGGVYHLAAPLRFTSADSAPQGGSITYAAAPGERVILSGGQPITGWREHGDVWETTIPEVARGEWYFRELFVGDRRATRARTPNEGYFRVEKAGPDNRTSFTYQDGDLRAWRDLKQGEIAFLHDWSMSRIGLKSIDPERRVITFRDPIGPAARHYRIDNYEPHPRYYIENLPELLDAPGEWYLDRKTGLLRYWPREGEKIENVVAVAPRLESLLEIQGQENRPVRGLKFVGLTFRHCRWAPPEHGYAAGQATMHEQRDDAKRSSQRGMMPAALTLSLAEDCAFEDCAIEQLGASGVELGQTCRDNRLLRCRVRDVAGNGVNIGEMFTRGELPKDKNAVPPLVASGNRVENCTISNCGALYYGSVGVWIGIAANTHILYNELSQLPYTGVSVGWRWNPDPTGCRGNVIADNHIHDIMQILSDGGGIYTLGLQPGTILRGNRIHDVPVNAGRAESNGIFMDEGSTAILVEGNTIYNIARSPIRFHQAGVNTIRDNVLVSAPGIPTFRYNSTPMHMRMENNTKIEAKNWHPPTDDPTRDAGPVEKLQ